MSTLPYNHGKQNHRQMTHFSTTSFLKDVFKSCENDAANIPYEGGEN